MLIFVLAVVFLIVTWPITRIIARMVFSVYGMLFYFGFTITVILALAILAGG